MTSVSAAVVNNGKKNDLCYNQNNSDLSYSGAD